MLEIKNLTKKYGEVTVLDNLSLTLDEGKITCVLGESGCGKSTLLNALAKVISFEGEFLGAPNKISYILQNATLADNLTVKDNVRLVLDKSEYALADEMLARLEIADKANVYPKFLSGGQRQRVSIARAFAYGSELLLMDEPFSSLDTALKIRLIQAFVELYKAKRRTVLFVTHDVEEAAMLSDKVIVLRDGSVAEEFCALSDEYGQIPRPFGSNEALKQRLLNAILK